MQEIKIGEKALDVSRKRRCGKLIYNESFNHMRCVSGPFPSACHSVVEMLLYSYARICLTRKKGPLGR